MTEDEIRKIEKAEFEARCASDPVGALEFCKTLDPDNPVHKELAQEILAAVRMGQEFMDMVLTLDNDETLEKPKDRYKDLEEEK